LEEAQETLEKDADGEEEDEEEDEETRGKTQQEIVDVVVQEFFDEMAFSGEKPTPEMVALQGTWEDLASGCIIDIVGNIADFNDGTDIHHATHASEGLTLRGFIFRRAMEEGLLTWQRPEGGTMLWARADHVLHDPTWAKNFHHFKVSRTVLRRRLARALEEEDLESVSAMQLAWESAWGCPKEATPTQELRLAAGRHLIPGVCVRHRRHDLRAVVLGCEPWVRATHARRMTEEERDLAARPGLNSYRLQPMYCCLLDDRDISGGGIVFMPEADLIPDDEVYPLESTFVPTLLEPLDAIRGYIPKAPVRAAMARQQIGLPFMLMEE